MSNERKPFTSVREEYKNKPGYAKKDRPLFTGVKETDGSANKTALPSGSNNKPTNFLHKPMETGPMKPWDAPIDPNAKPKEPVFSRTGLGLSGTVKRRIAGHAGTAENLLSILRDGNTVASENRKRAEAERQNAANYRRMLATGYGPNGKRLASADRKKFTELAERSERNAKSYLGGVDGENANITNVINKVDNYGDRTRESAENDLARGRQGFGRWGNLAYDVATGAIDPVLDAAENLVLPGLGTASRMSRMYGQGAEEAQADGANLFQQTLTGGAMAGIGEATNRLLSSNPLLQKAYGKGALDDILLPNVGKTLPGRFAKSFLGEGSEEGLEYALDYLAKRGIYDHSGEKTEFSPKEMGYESLVGGLIGGLTGIPGGKKPQNILSGPTDVVREPVNPNPTVDTTKVETPVESVKTPPTVAEESKATPPVYSPPTVRENRTVAENATTIDGANRSIKVYRGFNRSQNPTERNLASRQTAFDIIGKDSGKDVEMLPYSYYTENQSDAEMYANHDQQFMSELIESAKRDYRQNVIDGKIPDGVSEETWVNQKAAEKYKVLTGRDAPSTGSVEEFTISPNRVLDLYDLGNTVDLDSLYNFLEKETGIPASKIDDELVLSDLSPEGDEFNAFKLLRNAPGSDVGTRFYNFIHRLGYDAVRYNENGNSHYALMPNKPADTDTNVGANEANPSIGAADEGFSTPGMNGEENTSKFRDHRPFDESEQRASGLNREAYEALFRYKTQTEGRSRNLAEEAMYAVIDGERRFIKDIDEEAYTEIRDGLADASAWDGVQMDAAHMILNELKRRALAGEIPQSEYTSWLKTVREHKTSGGQGVQASAKWYREDNADGHITETEALENLEKSNLTPEEQEAVFQNVLHTDAEIESATTADQLKDIIMRVGKERGVIKGKTGGFFDNIVRKALDTLTIDQLKQFAYSSSAALTTDSNPANIGQKIKTIQVLNMLSSMTTPSKNLAGNTSFYLIDILSMKGAGLIDALTSKATGTRSIATEKFDKAVRDSAIRAMKMSIAEIALDVDMASSESRYGTGSNRTFKKNGTGVFNTRKGADRFLERVLSTVERNQAYLLTATDEFYKGAARGTESQTQKLIDSGAIKTDNENYAKEQADALAKYRTFQNNSRVSAAIQTIHDVLNMVAGVGDSGKTIGGLKVHSFGAGDIVAPFTRVAGNLVQAGIDYSPVKAVQGAVEVVKQVYDSKHGNSDVSKQAKGVSDLARGLTGTAIAYGFSLLVGAGIIRQAEDEDDPDVAALNQSEGMRGTQINLDAAERFAKGGSAKWQDGDTLVDLSSIEPLNFLVNLGVEVNKGDGNFLQDSLGATVDSAMAAATELPVLQTIGDGVTDVVKYGADPKDVIKRETADTLISSAIPNILASSAKALDDRPRNLFAEDGLGDYIKSAAKNKIPFVRETLPGSVNTLGEVKKYQGSEANPLVSMVSPVRFNTYKQSALSREMERVRNATGETNFYPDKAVKKELSYTDKKTGKKVVKELSYDQRNEYQTIRSKTSKEVGEDLISDKIYTGSSHETKAKLLDGATQYANSIAKMHFLGSNTADKWIRDTKAAEKSTGLKPSTVIIYRNMLSEQKKSKGGKDASDYVRKKILADKTLTTKQKNALDNIVISDGMYIPVEKDVDYKSGESFYITQMSDSAQAKWPGIKSRFGISPEEYRDVYSICYDDDLSADQKRAKLYSMGYNGGALYKAVRARA